MRIELLGERYRYNVFDQFNGAIEEHIHDVIPIQLPRLRQWMRYQNW